MRVLFATLLATSLLATGAFAANSDAGLAPGKPSGVKKAQDIDNSVFWVLGVGAVAAVAIVAATGGSGAPVVNPSATVTQ